MENLALIGRLLVFVGLGLAALGGVIWLVSKIPGIQELPGTIKIEGSGVTCIIPLLASVVLSILLTIILNLIARGINK
jgi:hypothetical protein